MTLRLESYKVVKLRPCIVPIVACLGVFFIFLYDGDTKLHFITKLQGLLKWKSVYIMAEMFFFQSKLRMAEY